MVPILRERVAMSFLEMLPRYTYDDYALWEGDWEMIEGIPVSMAPAPVRLHQQIAGELFFAFKEMLDEACACEILYETDWKIANDTVVRPDIVLVCDDEGEKYLTKAPRVIVEILSPSTAQKDETVKYDLYETEKVTYYILVYPDDLKAKVYKMERESYTKVGDFTRESLALEDIGCNVVVDFGRVFRRFRG